MKVYIPSIKEYKVTIKRFPLSVISALIVTFVAIYMIEIGHDRSSQFEPLLRLAFVSSLGVFLFTALSLIKRRSLLCLLGIVALLSYYLLLPDIKNPPLYIFTRHTFLALASFIMILWAPFYNKSVQNEIFWEWSQRVLFGFFTSVVFSIVLYAGLSGGLFAIDKLFSLGISGKRYGELWFIVVGFFGVGYFLSQIPKDTQHLTPHTYTKVENIFTKYILTPLAFGYFVILYTYSAKILITQEWPKGILAWIIIAFSAVALTTYLLWTPLWSKKLKRYNRFFFVILFLQTLMLALAIYMRIDTYGWTENRYMVALLGGWLGGVSIYFILFRDARYKWIFLTLSLFILISQIGFWSSYEVGKKSQQNRLTRYLKNNPNLSEDSPLRVRYEISSMIGYLSSHFGVNALESILPDIVKKYKKDPYNKKVSYGFAYFATKELGFEYVYSWQIKERKNGIPVSVFRAEPLYQNISGYDWMVDLLFSSNKDHKEVLESDNQIKETDTTFTLNNDRLIIKEQNRELANIDLKEFFENIIKKSTINGMADEKTMTFLYQNNQIKIKLMVKDLFIDRAIGYENINAVLLYKRIE